MFKEKLFRFLFPNKYGQLSRLKADFDLVKEEAKTVREALNDRPTISDLMRDSLGLPMIYFDDVDEEGKPPHYLKDLTKEEREHWVADLTSIKENEHFQTVVSYVINLFGNHSLQVAEEENMKNGRYAIVGMRTFLKEFEEAENEHLSNKKQKEEFNKHEVL